jgi:hypothetical protein
MRLQPMDYMRTIVFTDDEFETAIVDGEIGELIRALQSISTWSTEIADDLASRMHYGEAQRIDTPSDVYEVKSDEQAAAILGAIELLSQQRRMTESMRVLRHRLQGRRH